MTDVDQGPGSGRWGQERRLEFVDFRLQWEGRINRSDLVDFFGISIQQASLDLARYMEIAPSNLEYDKSEKVYRATGQFKPVLTPSESQSFLDQLLAVTTSTLAPSLSFIGWRPPCDAVRFPSRVIHPDILVRVLSAIRDRQDLELEYQSFSRATATRRWIAPHAIAYDGFRWHVRAWCHEHNDFRDFVLTRIQGLHGARKSEIDPKNDADWNSWVTLVLRPHRGLTKEQSHAVELEYGMVDGVLHVPTRRALLFYLVQQLRLDREREASPQARQIEWANEEELRPILSSTHR